MPDRLLSLRQLADRWGWSVDRVYRLVQKKEIPHIRLGRDFYFREADVDAWLAAKTVQPKTLPQAQAARARRSDREWGEVFGLSSDDERVF